jgi:hypothetical protein
MIIINYNWQNIQRSKQQKLRTFDLFRLFLNPFTTATALTRKKRDLRNSNFFARAPGSQF